MKILHLTENFYTGTACGACDKYEVCSSKESLMKISLFQPIVTSVSKVIKSWHNLKKAAWMQTCPQLASLWSPSLLQTTKQWKQSTLCPVLVQASYLLRFVKCTGLTNDSLEKWLNNGNKVLFVHVLQQVTYFTKMRKTDLHIIKVFIKSNIALHIWIYPSMGTTSHNVLFDKV